MQKQNKSLRILESSSGASFIFVLGIMLLLMAIGISVLGAAGANTGFVLKQKEAGQIMLLDDSVHRNIMYSLQRDTSDSGLLSAQLVKAVYEANDPDLTWSYSPSGLADMPLDISIDNGVDLENGNIKIESITLSFPEQNVIITPPVAAIYTPDIYDDENNLIASRALDKSRDPKTATVDATMIVTVEINANGKIVTSKAIYKYTGGYLSDDPDASGATHAGDDTPGSKFDMAFKSNGYGEWRLMKRESTDSRD